MGYRVNYAIRSVVATALAASALLSTPSLAGPQYRRITILHTNDTHAHLIPFNYPDLPNPGQPAPESWPSVLRDTGGIARRATIARQIEREMKRNVLLIDAGDQLDGTPFSVEYMGEADYAAMNAAGYDLKTLGNHEFSANLAQFNRNLKMCAFPTLCANVIERASGKAIEPRYQIMDFDGARVAFFGLVTPVPTYQAAKQGYDFADPIQTARELVPELRKLADIVIAITHIGFDVDQQLAGEVPGIDAIVGGHSHTRLTAPIVMRNSNSPQAFAIGGTVITQAGQWGQELGRLDLRLRGDGSGRYTLMSCSGAMLPITKDTPEDPKTAQAIAKYRDPIWKQYGEILGEATVSFYNEGTAESTVLNLVCDAMREQMGADIAFYNTGGIRSDIARGPLRMWDIATTLPFSDNAVAFDINGRRLKQALADMKPGVSGVRYVLDEKNQLIEATVNGKPIEDAATYKLVINSFFANGALDDLKRVDTGKSIRGAVVSYIKTKKAIAPSADGRRVVKSEQKR